MNTNLVVKLTQEMVDMQEMVDDPEATCEMRSNARSYIRGIKKAMAIMAEESEKGGLLPEFEQICDILRPKGV